MGSRDKREGTNLTIIEAVETLSSIADLEIDKEVGIAQQHDLIIQDKKVVYKTVHWLHKQDADKTVNLVKETFRVILNYLRNFYKKEYGYVTNQQAIEGIKTIMVLVGEAAKKLDKCTTLFHQAKAGSVTELKEYKRLQEFYLTRIARKIDEGVLGKWILALSKRTLAKNSEIKLDGRKALQTRHVFVDLESVKKDTEYELFFMRKEDGSRFFSPRLIRNIKLVCDFGDFFGEAKEKDPLVDINIWQDRCLQAAAKGILHSLGHQMDRFYHDAFRYKDRELVIALNKAIMSLMLCSNPRNLMKNMPMKSCLDYFLDFQKFLREALQSDDYRRLITYGSKKSSKLGSCLMKVTHGLCRGLYINLHRFQDFGSLIQSLLLEASEIKSKDHKDPQTTNYQTWNKLATDYAAMAKLFKRHSSGPLIKVLDVLQEGTYHHFEPLGQQNLPNQLYSLCIDDKQILNLHLPSPTNQEVINKIQVIDEFKGFLRSCAKDEFIRKHLILNVQDKTSWRECTRCSSLEDLQYNDEFDKYLSVITLAKDTEFYHQLAPYHQDNHAEVFLSHFKEHLGDESSGYYFTPAVKRALTDEFVDGLLGAIHRVFFSGKNILLREHRLDFIEIFDLFLTLKILEVIKPDSFSFTCKDGVDTGASSSALLFVFLKLMNQESLTTADWQTLNALIYAPAVIIRERIMLPDRFNRMVSALKTIEFVHNDVGQAEFAKIINENFGHFYKRGMLKALATQPKVPEYQT